MLNERIHISEPELIYTDEQMRYTSDGSCGTVRQPDGKIDFWTTDLGALPYYRHFRGTTEDPFAEELPPFEWDYNGYKDTWPCGLWVQGLYQCDEQLLLGFVHREDIHKTDPEYKNNYHIGFGVSHDAGKHWKYPGDVCGNVANYRAKHANMGGVPFFAAKDGYFYFYFNDFDPEGKAHMSCARMPIQDTIEMIRRDELPISLVKKYTGNGIWDTDPMTGTAAPILPTVEGIHFDSHSDSAYCSALDQYLLLSQTGGCGKLAMFFSDDCEHWEGPMYLDEVEPKTFLQPYSTFVGLDDEASADEPAFEKVFEEDDGYVGFKIWKLSW
jgi:hypothetical protein